MPLTGDGYFAGEYPGGTTTVEGAPVSAAVLVYQRDSGQLIAQTESSQSGEWIVTGVDISKAHDIVGRKEGFNDVIVSNVMPTSMVDIAYTGEILPNETFTGALGYLDLVGGIPPYAASVVDPLPAGIFPVVNGRQLIIDGTTTDDDVFNSTVRITSSNGVTRDVPVKLVVGFKAPANFEAATIVVAGVFSVVLTWGVTNTTQEVLVFRSTTPFDLESMPAPIATLTGDAVSYTDDDVIEGDLFYYMVASVCEGFTLHSDGINVEAVGDPHWDNVVSLLSFDGDLSDATGKAWTANGAHSFNSSDKVFGASSLELSNIGNNSLICTHDDFKFGLGDFTIEGWFKPQLSSNRSFVHFGNNNLIYTASGYWAYYSPVGSNLIVAGTVSTTTFSHIALCRSSGIVTLFVNGAKLGTANQPTINMNQGNITIGRFNAGNPAGGLYDEIRVTKGVARYTENFTPPTEPFPNN